MNLFRNPSPMNLPITSDPILLRFLGNQLAAASLMASQNRGLLEITQIPPGWTPGRAAWHVSLRCKSLARRPDKTIIEINQVEVAVIFSEHYCRRVEEPVAWILHPIGSTPFVGAGTLSAGVGQKRSEAEIFHPNIEPKHGAVCLNVRPMTGLPEVIGSLLELLTYQKFNTVHGFNAEALEWARVHRQELPLDRPRFRIPRPTQLNGSNP